MSTVSIDFKIASQQALSGLKQINSSVQAVGKQVSTTQLAMANLASAAVIGGFKAITAGIRSLHNSMNEAINLAKIQEEAVNDLNTALKGAGVFSQAASEDLQKYASSLQKSSIYGDEAILKAQALGVSMAKLSGKQLKDATLAAANFASAMGVDLNTAMRLIAKSATDGGSGLKRYGIIVQEGATAADTLTNAIAATNKQFAGAAEGKINTYGGAVKQASNSFGDFMEEIGNLVTKNPAVIDGIQKQNEVWVELGQFVKDNADVIQKSIANIIVAVKSTVSTLVSLGKWIYENKEPLIAAFGGIAVAVTAMNAGFIVMKVQAALAWAAALAPVTAVVAGLALVGAGVFAVVKYWSDVKLAAMRAMAASLEALGVVSSTAKEKAAALREEIAAEEARISAKEEQIAKEKLQSEQKVEAKKVEIEQITALEDAKVEADNQKKVEAKKQAAKETAEKKKEDEKARKEQAAIEKRQLEQFKLNEQAKLKWERATWMERANQTREGLTALSGLMNSSNKAAFAVGQSAAIANAMVATYQSATNAYASLAGIPVVGPGLGAAAAAAAIVSGLANVARIKSQKPPEHSTFASGGIVPGTSFTGDNVPAYVNSSEMILNSNQQARLFDMANNGGGGNGLASAIERLGDRIANMEIVLQCSDYEIGRSVQRSISDGLIIKTT